MTASTDNVQPGNPMPRRNGPAPLPGRVLARLAGMVAAGIGAMALAGWLLGCIRLANWGAELIPMAPSSAILFVAYGTAAALARRPRSQGRFWQFLLFAFAAGGAIAGLLFLLSIPGILLDIEYLGIKAGGAVGGSPTGHMSPITAFTFLLMGLSFPVALTAPGSGTWRAWAPWWVAILLMAPSATLILAYLLGTPMFYGGSFVPPALTTSVAFLALAIALAALSQPLAWPKTDTRHGGASAQILILVFLLLVAGIISAGYFYHTNHQKHDLDAAKGQLAAIADLKMAELTMWREERIGDAALFYNNRPFATLARRWFRNSESGPARRELETWFQHIRENRNYNRIFLLDADGVTRLSMPSANSEPLSLSIRRTVAETMRTGRITFTDLYRHESTGKIFLAVLVPLFHPEQGGAPLGVLVMRIDPQISLYPLIKRWPDASNTADTALVRKEGDYAAFLTERRTRKESALNFRIPLERREIPAVMAVLGREGVVWTNDYWGNPVLAALLKVPDSTWFLVASMDAAEVYGPMRERLWITVLLMSTLLLSAGTGVGLVWRQQSAWFYRDKHQAELGHIELKERLVKIAANVPGGIFQLRVNPDGSTRLLYANQGVEEIYGVRPEQLELSLSPLFDAVHPDDLAGLTETIAAAGRACSPWHHEHRVMHPGKGEIWVEGTATAEARPDQSVVLHGFLNDITERKRSEEQIRLNRERLQSLLNVIQHQAKDNAALLDFALDEALRITDSNFGYIYYYDEERRQFTLNSWSRGVMHACSVRNPSTVYELDRTGIWGEAVRQRKPIMVNDFAAPNALKKGYPEGHVELRRFLTIPLFDRGRIVAVVGVANRTAEYGEVDVVQLTLLMDAVWRVTERRRAEEALIESKARLLRAREFQILNEQLEQRVKERTAELEASNQELEAFCYAVAHDLRTPLRGMSGFSQILLEDHADQLDDSGKEHLARIAAAAARMGDLINNLLNLSRVTRCKLSRERLDLSAMVRDIVGHLREQEPERRLELVLPEEIAADGDPILVKSVLENLFENAWKYTGKEPCSRIEFGCLPVQGETVHFVRDNGVGFDMAHASRIFLPFERLHGAGEFKGTGIGLATVQRIVARHGGRVWAEGEVERGASFYFTLGSQPMTARDEEL